MFYYLRQKFYVTMNTNDRSYFHYFVNNDTMKYGNMLIIGHCIVNRAMMEIN